MSPSFQETKDAYFLNPITSVRPCNGFSAYGIWALLFLFLFIFFFYDIWAYLFLVYGI